MEVRCRIRIVVSTPRCGRGNLSSNLRCDMFCQSIKFFFPFFPRNRALCLSQATTRDHSVIVFGYCMDRNINDFHKLVNRIVSQGLVNQHVKELCQKQVQS
jgi:hypothetical protein